MSSNPWEHWAKTNDLLIFAFHRKVELRSNLHSVDALKWKYEELSIRSENFFSSTCKSSCCCVESSCHCMMKSCEWHQVLHIRLHTEKVDLHASFISFDMPCLQFYPHSTCFGQLFSCNTRPVENWYNLHDVKTAIFIGASIFCSLNFYIQQLRPLHTQNT